MSENWAFHDTSGTKKFVPANLSAAMTKIWDMVPVDWQFVPDKVKAKHLTHLSYLRTQGLIETIYVSAPNEPSKRLMQWRRKQR